MRNTCMEYLIEMMSKLMDTMFKQDFYCNT